MITIASLLLVIKDTALTIMIAVTIDKLETGDKDRWARLLFLLLLFTW